VSVLIRTAPDAVQRAALKGKEKPAGVNRRAVLCLVPGRGTAGSGYWHRALTRVAVYYPLRGRIVARADQERRKHWPLPAVRSVGSGRRSHIRVGSDSGWAIVVPPRLLQFGLMVLNACPRVVGSNDTNRQGCAGCREAKRPDQEVSELSPNFGDGRAGQAAAVMG
jgi:hypothetical protein